MAGNPLSLESQTYSGADPRSPWRQPVRLAFRGSSVRVGYLCRSDPETFSAGAQENRAQHRGNPIQFGAFPTTRRWSGANEFVLTWGQADFAVPGSSLKKRIATKNPPSLTARGFF